MIGLIHIAILNIVDWFSKNYKALLNQNNKAPIINKKKSNSVHP